jgi:hypothetical protein
MTKDEDDKEVVAGLAGYYRWSPRDKSTKVMMFVAPKFRVSVLRYSTRTLYWKNSTRYLYLYNTNART